MRSTHDRSRIIWWSVSRAGAIAIVALWGLGSTPASATPAQTDPAPQAIPIHFDSRIDDISDEDLADQALATLNDPRGWSQAGIFYTSDQASEYQVILAEPAEVDALCAPLGTGGRVSCQNSNVVALNANRWRSATQDWDQGIDEYRHYLYNHEVGHLSGQFHPKNRCPVGGEPEAVMAQQTKGLEGCTGNAWPLDWEIERAKQRPLQLAPAPDVEPAQRAVNPGGGVPAKLPAANDPETPTTEAPATPAPTSAGAALPTTVDDGGNGATTTPSTTAAPKPDPAAAATPSEENVSVPAGSGGAWWLMVVAAVIGAVCLGGVLFTLISRSRRARGDAEWTATRLDSASADGSVPADVFPAIGGIERRRAPSPLTTWRVQVAARALRRAEVAWCVPERWANHDAEALGDTVQLLGNEPSPDSLVEAISTFLRAHSHLVPRQGESIVIAVVGDESIIGAALGEASLVERRSGTAHPGRERGVVRLHRDPTNPLLVDFLTSTNGRRRSVIRITERTSPPAAFADVTAVSQA